MGDEAAAICSLHSRLAPRHADLLEYRLITWFFFRQLAVQCWFKQLINRHVYSVQHVYTVYIYIYVILIICSYCVYIYIIIYIYRWYICSITWHANDGFSLLTGCEPSELGWSVRLKIPKLERFNCIGMYTSTWYLLVSIHPGNGTSPKLSTSLAKVKVT